MNTPLETRVKNYWSKRAHDFTTVRKNELADIISTRWMKEFEHYLPNKNGLDILDIGTGSGYFAILLAKYGYHLTGIDFTPNMLEEAKTLAKTSQLSIDFRFMDAQSLDFEDSSFDAIVTRNLTWTLPEPAKAYTEWFRVLKPGGILLNFDANYGNNVRHQNQKNSYINKNENYGHIGITKELEEENAFITLNMEISKELRPDWDMQVLKECHFKKYFYDLSVGERILQEKDLNDAPLFLIYAKK